MTIKISDFREEETGGWSHQNQEEEEEVVVECLLETAYDKPGGEVPAAAAEAGAGEGLPADGGGVHKELGAAEAAGGEQGQGEAQGR